MQRVAFAFIGGLIAYYLANYTLPVLVTGTSVADNALNTLLPFAIGLFVFIAAILAVFKGRRGGGGGEPG